MACFNTKYRSVTLITSNLHISLILVNSKQRTIIPHKLKYHRIKAQAQNHNN